MQKDAISHFNPSVRVLILIFYSSLTLPHKEYVYDYAIHKTKIEFQTRKTRVKYGPVVCHPLEVRGRLSVCV